MKITRPPRQLLLALVLVTSLAIVLVWTAAAQAQQPTPSGVTDDQVNAVAKQLYCPVCENIPLDVCPTTACAQWRALIREKLGQGWSEDQIKDYFVAQYGDRVLAVPPARGLNWLVYLIPPVAIIAGAFILYRAMRAWKQPLSTPAAPDQTGAGPDDPYTARLEEELRRR
jgi:cytochrome c-type biogenesis protein CcmH